MWNRRRPVSRSPRCTVAAELSEKSAPHGDVAGVGADLQRALQITPGGIEIAAVVLDDAEIGQCPRLAQGLLRLSKQLYRLGNQLPAGRRICELDASREEERRPRKRHIVTDLDEQGPRLLEPGHARLEVRPLLEQSSRQEHRGSQAPSRRRNGDRPICPYSATSPIEREPRMTHRGDNSHQRPVIATAEAPIERGVDVVELAFEPIRNVGPGHLRHQRGSRGAAPIALLGSDDIVSARPSSSRSAAYIRIGSSRRYRPASASKSTSDFATSFTELDVHVVARAGPSPSRRPRRRRG